MSTEVGAVRTVTEQESRLQKRRDLVLWATTALSVGLFFVFGLVLYV